MNEILKNKITAKVEEGLRFLNNPEASDSDRWHFALNCLGAAYNIALVGRDGCKHEYIDPKTRQCRLCGEKLNIPKTDEPVVAKH